MSSISNNDIDVDSIILDISAELINDHELQLRHLQQCHLSHLLMMLSNALN